MGGRLRKTLATQAIEHPTVKFLGLVASALFYDISRTCVDHLSGPQDKLVKEVKMIALAGHTADGFTWTLLKLARFADSLYFGGAPMLKHLFSKEEYSDAKKKINELIETKKGTAKGKNAKETMDLEFDNLFEEEAYS